MCPVYLSPQLNFVNQPPIEGNSILRATPQVSFKELIVSKPNRYSAH